MSEQEEYAKYKEARDQKVLPAHKTIEDYLTNTNSESLADGVIQDYGDGLKTMIEYLIRRNNAYDSLNDEHKATSATNTKASEASDAKINAQQAKIESLIKIAKRYQELATQITKTT